jgi:response regulator RpfG family c-di-GMP phosphodiesterase
MARQLKNQTVKNLLVKMLEGRDEDDVFPTFYRANDAETIAGIARQQGLDVRSIHGVETNALLSALGPLAIPELVLMRAMRAPWGERYRATLVSILVKPAVREARSVAAMQQSV